ncbi:MAG: hypothetical protein JW751_10810 [Polyangiaceae bacterium]|nr:hypothetical protein [Polyangiaceae bacterium]
MITLTTTIRMVPGESPVVDSDAFLMGSPCTVATAGSAALANAVENARPIENRYLSGRGNLRLKGWEVTVRDGGLHLRSTETRRDGPVFPLVDIERAPIPSCVSDIEPAGTYDEFEKVGAKDRYLVLPRDLAPALEASGVRFSAACGSLVLAASLLIAPSPAAAQPATPTTAAPATPAPTDYSQLIGHEVVVTWNGGSMTGRLLATDQTSATVVGPDGQTRVIGLAAITGMNLSPSESAAAAPAPAAPAVAPVAPAVAPPAAVAPVAPTAPAEVERYPQSYGRGGIIAGSILIGSGIAVLGAGFFLAATDCDESGTTTTYDTYYDVYDYDDDGVDDVCQAAYRTTGLVIGGGLIGGGLIPLLIGINRRKYAGQPVVAEGTMGPEVARSRKRALVSARVGPTRRGWAGGLTIRF